MAGSPSRRLRLITAVAALGLAASACGGGSDADVRPEGEVAPSSGTTGTVAPEPVPPSASAPAAPASTTADRSASILPSVRLTDITSGGTVDLATLVPAPQPLLLWFWAPH